MILTHCEFVSLDGESIQLVKDCWRNEGMSSLKDLLIKYQIDDVKLMALWIENMLEHYKVKGVCVFKECVLLPGVSKILMHRSARQSGSYFPLFNKSMNNLKNLFRTNVQGSLSVIQHRYEKIGETCIRNNRDKVCKSIIGHGCKFVVWICLEWGILYSTLSKEVF